MNALICLGVLIGTLCMAEIVVKRFPRLESRIDRWLGGDGSTTH